MNTRLTAMSLHELEFERDEAAAVMQKHDRPDSVCGGACYRCEMAEDNYDMYNQEITKRLRSGQ